MYYHIKSPVLTEILYHIPPALTTRTAPKIKSQCLIYFKFLPFSESVFHNKNQFLLSRPGLFIIPLPRSRLYPNSSVLINIRLFSASGIAADTTA